VLKKKKLSYLERMRSTIQHSDAEDTRERRGHQRKMTREDRKERRKESSLSGPDVV